MILIPLMEMDVIMHVRMNIVEMDMGNRFEWIEFSEQQTMNSVMMEILFHEMDVVVHVS